MVSQAIQSKKLLAIDGGGLRGLLALRVLKKIETTLREQSGKPALTLSDYFDYIAGTSTGGIVAAALAIGMSVDAIEAFYLTEAQRMFTPSRNLIKRFLYARYDDEPLKEKLKEVFGHDTTLGSDKVKTLLMLVMLNASTASPWPVSNNRAAKYNDMVWGGDSNLNMPLWQLVRASSAAPYFFEPETIQVGGRDQYFYDGALTTLNNPAFKLFQMATMPAYCLQWPTGEEQLLLVSIGTGMVPCELSKQSMLKKQVGSVLVNSLQSIMFAGTNEVDLQCRSLGKVISGDPIDSEVGDLIGDSSIGGSPLFSYIRYNATLTPRGLDELGCGHIATQTSFRLDDLSALEHFRNIGDAVGKHRVCAEHFSAFPA